MGKKLEAFLLRSETVQGCPLFPLLFNITLEVLADATRREKEMKETHWEGGNKTASADDMFVSIEVLKELTRVLEVL